MDESITTIEKIKEKQTEINEQLGNNGLSEDLKESQDGVKEDFDFARELLKEMRNINEELRRPNKIENTSSKEERIEDDIKKSINELNRENINRANETQNQLIRGLDDLANDLKEMQKTMKRQNIAEDIRSLRIILDNLIKTSFSQENLMEEFNLVNLRDPKYVGLIQEQQKIKEDLVLIQDSLNALASRQAQIKSFVNRELEEIKFNIEESIDHLINRRKHTGVTRQHYVMTHVNNLALLLNESMKNMQSMMQAMENAMGESGESDEFGFQDLREMQEQMNNMLRTIAGWT
jgi:hypothetical protein